MSLTIGSLFAGIGGLELGLERGIGDGAHTVFQVEQNAYCRAVLAKHWPDALRFDDVRTVGAENLPAVDVLCGGFPCQDVSAAGRRAGIVVGTRSGLWFEYSRIIRELRPRYVVVENVAALLTLGLDAVLGELAESGYDAEWDCIPASSVGAPHQRDRIFVVAYPAGDDVAWWGHPRADQRHAKRHAAVPERRSHYVANASGGDAQGIVPQRDDSQDWRIARERSTGLRDRGRHCREWAPEPAVGRVAHGIPERVDRLKALGNAVVPQVAEVVGRLIAQREAERQVAA